MSISIRADVQFLRADAGEGDLPGSRIPRFAMVGYTGGEIRQTWSREPIVIDLAGMSIPAAVPIVFGHDYALESVLGQASARVDAGQLVLDGAILATGEAAAQVVALGDRGYQWQASVGADVDEQRLVADGDTVTVNGQTFTGPVRVVSRSLLRECSFVTLGADAATAVTITAKAEEPQMSEEMKAADDPMPTGPEMSSSENGMGPTGPSDVASATPRLDVEAIVADIEKRITAQVEKKMLDTVRAGRGVTIHTPSKPHVDDNQVLAARVCMTGGLGGLEKHFAEPVLEAAGRSRMVSLQEILLRAAKANGYDRHDFKVSTENVRQVLRAAFSTHDIADLLAATYGKFLLASFNAVEAFWDRIAVIRSVNDFKTVTGLRLDGGFVFDEVGNDGKIKNADAGDDKRTIAAKTYARMSSITRQDIINDDLGALTQVPQRLGRGAALKLNSVFWSEFESGNDTAYEKKTAAAGNALSLTSLKAAVGDYRKLKDPDNNPLGITPAIILAPPELEVTAAELMGSSLIHGTSGAAPSTNVLAGRYQVVSSAYLTSATTWWLCANPADLPTMEVAFLNGQRQPTVEQAEADFDTLGVQIRGYFDFGVAKGDKRAAYRMATA